MEWFLKLDSTVQVAILGLAGGIIASAIGIIRELFKAEDTDELTTTHTRRIKLDEYDAIRLERLIAVLDNLVDAIDRHTNGRR